MSAYTSQNPHYMDNKDSKKRFRKTNSFSNNKSHQLKPANFIKKKGMRNVRGEHSI